MVTFILAYFIIGLCIALVCWWIVNRGRPEKWESWYIGLITVGWPALIFLAFMPRKTES